MSPWSLGFAVIVVGAVLAVILLFAFVQGTAKRVGTPLSAEERAAIQKADCRRLAVLYDQYQGGADSVERDMSAFRLVKERMKERGCAPPETVPLPTSNFPGALP